MKKSILILIAVICLQGCSSFSVDREIDIPVVGNVDVNYDNWRGVEDISLEVFEGVKFWK